MDKLFFIIVIMIAVFFANKADRREKKIYICFSILIFSLVAGLRGKNVGIDTEAYYYAFNNDFPYSWQFEEIGFRYISNILINIFKNPVYLMLIYALITNSLIINRLWDFRKKFNFPFMIFLYGSIFFVETLNIMRQFLAISVIFYFTRLLKKKKYITFLGIVLLMTLIHKSSLLGLLILVIYFWKHLSKKKKFVFGIPIFIILIFSMVAVLKYEKNHILNYFSVSNRINNLNLTYIYRFIIFVFSYMLYKCKKVIVYGSKSSNIFNETNDENLILDVNAFEINQISSIYFIGLCLTSMGMFYYVMARLGYFYLIFELLYWGCMTHKNNKNKNLNMWLISIYAIYVFALELIENGSGIFPYYINF